MLPLQGIDNLLTKKNMRTAIYGAVSFFIIPTVISKHARLKAIMLQDLEKGLLRPGIENLECFKS